MEGDHTNSRTKSYLFLAELGQGDRTQSQTTQAKAEKIKSKEKANQEQREELNSLLQSPTQEAKASVSTSVKWGSTYLVDHSSVRGAAKSGSLSSEQMASVTL
jgi:hypothetical protein